jgi:DNA-binding transcriptional MocR family regulator
LATGNPDPALLPDLGAFLPLDDWPTRLYNEPADYPGLVAASRRSFASDGIPSDHLAICGGAMDAIERALAAHLRPGDRVAVEDPGHGPLHALVAAMGLVARPIALDDRGLEPHGLARALAEGVRAVILTPRAQNPTGAALDADRAAALSELMAGAPHLLVVEDDHAGPAAGAPAMTTSTAAALWAVVRSFSKWLGPDLRLAAVAGDAVTLARLRGRQALGAGWASYLLQATAAAALADPSTQALVDRAAARYTERRRALVGALTAAGIDSAGRSGLNVWIPLADPSAEDAVVGRLRRLGWAVAPSRRFTIGHHPAVRITVAELAPDDALSIAREVAASLGPPRHTHTA